jgi:DNA repair exonuclease SbcCD ATPase subunit
MRYLKLLLLALAATALVAAGCGDDDGGDSGSNGALSNEDYASEVRDVLEPLGSELQRIGDTVRASESQQELADSVRSAEDRLQQSIDELESLEPPSDAEAAHQELIGALTDFQGSLNELSSAADAEDTAEVIQSASRLPGAAQELQSRLNEVRQQLEDAGIDVGGAS